MLSIFEVFLPEIFLTVSALIILIFNAIFAYNSKFKNPILNFEILIQTFTILILTLFLFINLSYTYINFDFFFFNSSYTQNLKIFLLLLCICSLVTVWRSFVLQKLNFFEYFIIYLLIIVGLCFLINSYNLISIYLCLEIQALGFYILSSFNRESLFSSEAGLKYFISSSLISGIFLFGTSLIYGSFGTLNLNELEFLIRHFFDYPLNFSFSYFIFGCLLILSALLFKLVIAPFHFWFPQIYDGSPLSSTIIFTLIPKIALVNLFIQIWSSVYLFTSFFETIFFLIGLYSLVFGIYKLLQQKKLKKFYIYSSISNMGLLLCVLIDNSINSTVASFFFLIFYLLTLLLAWCLFIFITVSQNKNFYEFSYNYPIYLTYFNNIFFYNKTFAISICILFFSLAAIPPFMGFLSKTYLYLILINNFKYEMALFLIYIGVFGIYYYVNFLKIIFFENKKIAVNYNIYPIPYSILDSTIYSAGLIILTFSFYEISFFIKLFEIFI